MFQQRGRFQLKWVEIAASPNKLKFDTISNLLTKHGFENTVEYLSPTPDEFDIVLEEAKKTYNFIRIGAPFGEQAAQDDVLSTAMTLTLQSVDSMVYIDKNWWPRCFLEKYFDHVIAEFVQNVDFHSRVLIIGVGAAARALVLPLIRSGFKKISFTDKYFERGQNLVWQLNKKIFNVDFEFIKREDISLLPGSTAIVINTTPDIPSNDLIKDLIFFNYLQKSGWVIDFNINKEVSSFIKQGQGAGVNLVPGYKVASIIDAWWVKECFGVEISEIELMNSYLDFFTKQSQEVGYSDEGAEMGPDDILLQKEAEDKVMDLAKENLSSELDEDSSEKS